MKNNNSLKILKKYWGFNSFREPQQEIIDAVLAKKDTVALLPTGGGKSICFQVPALLSKGVCIVISPLIALMQDQVANLNKKGIKATLIESGTTQADLITLFDNLQFGNQKFLYISPERLQSKFIQDKIKQLTVSIIAVDEAHCISEWGQDFRPSYRKISILKEIQPKATTIALTATATQKVIEDIVKSLKIEKATVFKKSFLRENLAYQFFKTEDKLYKLIQIFTKTKQPAIVYVNTRKKTKKISQFLNQNGFYSSFYHGGLSLIEKKIAFENWMNETTPIMVATNAFGMGIDKPNVRVVAHLHLPASLENYMQEAGRAGRDGKKSFSVVLINNSDVKESRVLFKKTYPLIEEIQEVHKKLYQHFQISKGELVEKAFDFNFLEFCNKYNFQTSKTYNTLQILQNNGIIQLSNNYQQKSAVQVLVNSPQIFQYVQQGSFNEQFINVLLRVYGGLFENKVKIDEFFLAKKLETTSTYIINKLENLDKEGVISYKKAGLNEDLYFLVPREDNRTINRVSKDIKAYLKQKKQKIEDVISFAQNKKKCRSSALLNYFDEKSTKECKICDICLANKKTEAGLSEKILQLIDSYKVLSSKEICEKLNITERDVLKTLSELLSEESLAINNYNKYYKL